MKTESYFETASGALDQVEATLAKNNATVDGDFRSYFNGINYGETRAHSFTLSSFKGKNTRKGLHITLYRLETGRYELTSYFN